MSERIVLIFAYHFPPENAIGGARPYRFYKYLSQLGYRCHVITAADQTKKRDPNVEYVPDPFLPPSRNSVGWHLERVIRKLLMPGVAGIRWSRLASRAARELVQSHPTSEITVFSTFPPHGTHLAAFHLVRTNKLKWIADFRDPLNNSSGHIGLSKMQKSWNRWLEQLFFKRADVVIANTDAMAEKWKNAYPDSSDRIHLIWNGFDPEDPIDPRPAPKRDFKLISHVGELYRGRNVSALLESISRLIYTKRLEPNHVRVQLVGSIENDCLPAADFLKQAKKEGWLEIVPERVPQEEARRIAQTSDALLLVQPQSRIQVPGKLFDYLRLRRPILAYVLPNTPIERILKQTGVTYSCVYAGSPPQQIDDALENFFHLQGDAMPANSWFEDNFDARKQTQTLDTLIRSMHER